MALTVDGAAWHSTALGPSIWGPSKADLAAREPPCPPMIENGWSCVLTEREEREVVDREERDRRSLRFVNTESELATLPILIHLFFLWV